MKTISKSKEYKVHPDDFDVRGWNLVVDDVKLGTVNDLVLDDDRLRVKYLDVLRKGRGDEKDYHYLIPMNEVVFDKHKKYVYLERNSHHFIDSYPRFSNEIPPDYEERIRVYYSDTNSGKTITNYENKAYEGNRTYEDRAHMDEIRATEGKEGSLFGRDYERIPPENREEKINILEKQKQIKRLEFERDIAIIDNEILQLKSKH